jgi:hypothetical protein
MTFFDFDNDFLRAILATKITPKLVRGCLGAADAVEHPHTIRFIRLRKRLSVAPRFRRDESVAMALPAAVVTAPLDAFYAF